jgi:transposase-like protein
MARISQAFKRKPGPTFKLSPADADAVREAHEQSEETMEDIALRYGVTRQTIYNALRRLRGGQK